MKKWVLLLMTFVLAAGIFLAGCGGKKGESSKNGADNGNNGEERPAFSPSGDPNLEGKVTVWAIVPDVFEAIIPAFNEYYPKIQVEVVNQGFDVVSRTLTAIAAGKGGPDIVYYHFGWHAELTNNEGLEDLLQPPYNAGRFEPYFAEAAWKRALSLDGNKLLGFPQDIVPYTLAYRADILEDYGYPTDPDELAEYLADEDNYIDMALTFLQDGMYIMQMKTMDLHFMPNEGFFDRELNYTKNNETTLRYLRLMQREHQLGLVPNLMVVFSDDANQAVDSGKLIMLRSDINTGGYIEDFAPSTMGKWRMSRMPLNGNNAGQGFNAAILSQSKNKEAAWALIEFAFATLEGQRALKEAGLLGFPGFKPMWEEPGFIEEESEAFGGQRINELGVELIQEAPIYVSTPFDKVAKEIFDRGIEDAIDNNTDPVAALQKIQNDTEAAISQDLQKYKETMGME